MAYFSIVGSTSSREILLRRRLILAVGFVLVCISACDVYAGYPPPNDNVIQSPNCVAPCWHGLRPGVSHAQDVLNVIQSNKYFQDAGTAPLTSKDMTAHSQGWYYATPNDPGRFNEAVIRDDTVIQLIIYNYARTTLGDVIANVGPPTSYLAYMRGEVIQTVLVAYAPEKGYAVEMIFEYQPKPRFDKGSRVSTFYFFQPTTLDTMLDLPHAATLGSVACTRKNIQAWQGFGVVDTPVAWYGC